MRPGITHIDDRIEKEDFVVVVDETHDKALAVGIAMYCSGERRKLENGKVIKNVHQVGDEIWHLNI